MLSFRLQSTDFFSQNPCRCDIEKKNRSQVLVEFRDSDLINVKKKNSVFKIISSSTELNLTKPATNSTFRAQKTH